MNLRSVILSTVGLLIALSDAANGQDASANKSPGPQQQPTVQQQQKRKVVHARRHDSPAPQLPAQPTPDMKNRAGGSRNVKEMNNARANYTEALRRYRRERHNRDWWKQRYTVIVLVGGGYYYWDAGYWFPAWGYDPIYEAYDYDGPIFTYGNLLPDQVIVNVQRALKQLGYYNGGLTGSLGPSSRQALANYQEAAGLDVTGAIDAPTVQALGLI